MAVTDSPLTKVKARDAQKFMQVKDPAAASKRMGKLLTKHDLRGLVVVMTANQSKPIILTAVPDDKDGARILQDWAQRTIPSMPDRLEDGAVLIAIRKDGWIDAATWGSDARACEQAADWSDGLMELLPVAPFQTWFGWGTGGVPTKMTDIQLLGLTVRSVEYVSMHTHPDAVEPIPHKNA